MSVASRLRQYPRGLALDLLLLSSVPHSYLPPRKKRVFGYASLASLSRSWFFHAVPSFAHFTVGFFSPILHTLFMGMLMINIEVSKDVPLPEPKRRYPYKVMEVGESFFIPLGKLQVVCNANYRASKKLGFKFIARCEEGGVRVWRMS